MRPAKFEKPQSPVGRRQDPARNEHEACGRRVVLQHRHERIDLGEDAIHVGRCPEEQVTKRWRHLIGSCPHQRQVGFRRVARQLHEHRRHLIERGDFGLDDEPVVHVGCSQVLGKLVDREVGEKHGAHLASGHGRWRHPLLCRTVAPFGRVHPRALGNALHDRTRRDVTPHDGPGENVCAGADEGGPDDSRARLEAGVWADDDVAAAPVFVAVADHHVGADDGTVFDPDRRLREQRRSLVDEDPIADREGAG